MFKNWLGNKEKDRIISKVDKIDDKAAKAQIIELINELDAIESKVAELEKSNIETAANNNRILSDRQQELKDISDNYQKQYDELTQNLEKLLDDQKILDQKFSDLRKSHDLDIKDFKEKHNKKLKDLNSDAEASINEALAELKANKADIDAKVNDEVNNLHNDLKNKVDKIQDEINEQVEKMQSTETKHQEDLNALENSFNEKLGEIESNIDALNESNRHLDETYSHSENKNERKVNELVAKHDKKLASIELLIKNTREQIEQDSGEIRNNSQNILKDLLLKEQELKTYLANTQKQFEIEKVQIDNDFNVKLDELKQQENISTYNYESLLERYNLELKNYQAKLQEYDEEKARLNKENDELAKKLSLEEDEASKANDQKLKDYEISNAEDLENYRLEQNTLIENEKVNAEEKLKNLKINLSNEEKRLLALIDNLSKVKLEKEISYNNKLDVAKDELAKVKALHYEKKQSQEAALEAKENEIKALQEEQRLAVLALEDELKAARTELQVRIEEASNNAKIEQDKQIAINDNLNSQINDLLHVHDLDVEKNQTDLKNAQDEYASRLQTIKDAQDDIIKSQADLKTKVLELNQNHEKELASIEESRQAILAKHKQALEELDGLHVSNRDQLEIKYRNLKDEQLSDFNARVEQLKVDTEKAIEELNNTDAARNQNYEARLAEIEANINAFVADMQAQIKAQEDAKAEMLETIKANETKFEADTQALNEEVVKLNADQDNKLNNLKTEHAKSIEALANNEKTNLEAISAKGHELKEEEIKYQTELDNLRTSNQVEKSELYDAFDKVQREYAASLAEEEKKRDALLAELEKIEANNRLEIPHLNEVIAAKTKEVNDLEISLTKELNNQANINQEKILTYENNLKNEIELLNAKQREEYEALEDKNFNEYHDIQDAQRRKEIEYLEKIKALQAKKTTIRKEYLANCEKVQQETLVIKENLEKAIVEHGDKLDAIREEILETERQNARELKELAKTNEDIYYDNKNKVHAKVADAKLVNANISDNITALRGAIVSENLTQQRYKEDLKLRVETLEKIYKEKIDAVRAEVVTIQHRLTSVVSKHSADVKELKDSIDALETKRKKLLVEHPVKLSDEMYHVSFELERRKEGFDRRYAELEDKHREILAEIIAKQRQLIEETKQEIAYIDENIRISVERTNKSNEEYQDACEKRLVELSKPKQKYSEIAQRDIIDFKNDEDSLRNDLNTLREKFEKAKYSEQVEHNQRINETNQQAAEQINKIDNEGSRLSINLALEKEKIENLFEEYSLISNEFEDRSRDLKDYYENNLFVLNTYVDATLEEVEKVLKKNDILSEKNNLMDFFR